MTLKQGDKAPDFTLPDQEWRSVKLSDYKGDWILLYFYPKDDTPGCTAEACGLRDRFEDLGDLGVTVLGISADSVKSHAKFVLKHGLPFTLLSDEKRGVIDMYGAAGALGTSRMSFLIDPDGDIAKVYASVKPAMHAEEVYADVTRMNLNRE